MNGLRQICMHNKRHVWMNAFPAFKPDYVAETAQVLSCEASRHLVMGLVMMRMKSKEAKGKTFFTFGVKGDYL